MESNRRILHIVLNEFLPDPRVLRAATVGKDIGAIVDVYALNALQLPQNEIIDSISIRRFQLRSKRLSKRTMIQLGKYSECFARMSLAGIKLSPLIVHAHDLSALPIGYFIARTTGAYLIYDSHELWIESQAANRYPSWLLRFAGYIEKRLARRANQVITVSPGIAERLARSLDKSQVTVVRNIPDLVDSYLVHNNSLLLRETLGISKDDPVILYQGLVGAGRGVENLVEAMTSVSHPSAKLVILGSGPQEQKLHTMVANYNLCHNRVFFHSAVPPYELPFWTRDADIGIHPMSNTCENHRLALPNKLFEYIHAGLAILATDLPEMSRLIRTYGLGDTFRDRDPIDIASKIDNLLSTPERLADYQAASRSAAKILNWKSEREKLISIYESFFTSECDVAK